MKQHSFTLSELLICLVLVALGAALLTPCISGAAAAGREEQCRANLKEIVGAQMQYAGDNQQFLAGFFRHDGKNRTWSRTLVTDNNYLLGSAFLSCPDNPSPEGASKRRAASAIWDFNCYGFYVGNNNVDGWDYAKRIRPQQGDFAKGAIFTDFYALELKAMKNPAQLVIFADTAKTTGLKSPTSYFSPRGYFQEGAVNLLHGARANTATADGAIQPLSAQDLASGALGFNRFSDENFNKLEL